MLTIWTTKVIRSTQFPMFRPGKKFAENAWPSNRDPTFKCSRMIPSSEPFIRGSFQTATGMGAETRSRSGLFAVADGRSRQIWRTLFLGSWRGKRVSATANWFCHGGGRVSSTVTDAIIVDSDLRNPTLVFYAALPQQERPEANEKLFPC